jgi:hypothetical protein
MSFKTYTHIIRPRADRRSNCHDDALCGFRPGCVYVTLGRDERMPDIPDDLFPPCPSCALAHLREHYAALAAAAPPVEEFPGEGKEFDADEPLQSVEFL